jgi:hypothetical protein
MPVHPRFSATSNAELEGLVFGLAAQSYAQMLERRGDIPDIYSGKIRYQREPLRRENWQAARETSVRGVGDCEDLSAYLVAQYRAKGVLAFPVVEQVSPTLRHVLVRVQQPDGSWVMEDPSKRLGM